MKRYFIANESDVYCYLVKPDNSMYYWDTDSNNWLKCLPTFNPLNVAGNFAGFKDGAREVYARELPDAPRKFELAAEGILLGKLQKSRVEGLLL